MDTPGSFLEGVDIRSSERPNIEEMLAEEKAFGLREGTPGFL